MTYVRVSSARFTFADIRKVRRRNNSICVHFRIPFLYSCRNDVRYHIWTMFVAYFTSIYDFTLNLVVFVNSIILRIDLNSFLFVEIFVIYLVMHKFAWMTVFFPTLFLRRRIIFVFLCSLLARITDEIEHPCCLSSHGEFLIVLIYCVIFTLASQTCLSVSV